MRSPPSERTDIPALKSFVEYCRVRHAPARSMIVHAGDVSDSLFYVLEGSVEVMIEDEEGKEIVLAYLNPGHFFGEMGFFAGQTERTAWVRARTSCRIAEMTYVRFRQVADENPELVMELAVQLATRLSRTNRKIGDLAFLDVTGRVAHALINLAEEPDAVSVPGGMAVSVTRSQLARLVGCTREMVGKVLKILVDQNLIEDQGRVLVVLRRPDTQMIAEDDSEGDS